VGDHFLTVPIGVITPIRITDLQHPAQIRPLRIKTEAARVQGLLCLNDCQSARGSDADRHDQPPIRKAMPGVPNCRLFTV